MKLEISDLDVSKNWEKIFNIVNDGVMLVKPDGTIFRVNQALEALLGYSEGELNGKRCSTINCDACDAIITKGKKCFCTFFQKGRDIEKKCIVSRKDGSYLPVFKRASILNDSKGRLIGAVESFTDISEIQKLDREIHLLTRHIHDGSGFQGIIGQSTSMKKVFDVIAKAAQSEAPILITGESGTGKELAAQAIHKLSTRKAGPFVQINCAALNAALLESELFGHIKGAFTGACQHRIGRFEYANGGTLLLDEIGDIPLSVQVKLLSVLESMRIERVGENRPIPVNVRLISTTNKNLMQLIANGGFRQDLFFRINVIPIDLPPLRDRLDDIPILLNAFLYRLQRLTGKRIQGLSKKAIKRIMSYHWPGNVRELKSALEYALVLKENGLIDAEDLPNYLKEIKQGDETYQPVEKTQVNPEKTALIQALKQTLGNKSQAARILNVSRSTVWNRMHRYGIDMKKVLRT
jgi:PAS domain S-box-containing protein